MAKLFKRAEMISVPYQEFAEYVNVIGPVKGINLRPGKVHNVVVSVYPHEAIQVIDIIFWGSRKNVNTAKAKLLEFEYSKCNRFL